MRAEYTIYDGKRVAMTLTRSAGWPVGLSIELLGETVSGKMLPSLRVSIPPGSDGVTMLREMGNALLREARHKIVHVVDVDYTGESRAEDRPQRMTLGHKPVYCQHYASADVTGGIDGVPEWTGAYRVTPGVLV